MRSSSHPPTQCKPATTPLDRFLCPNCGRTAISGAESRPTDGLVTGNFMCPEQHIFTVRWLEAS